MLQFKKIKMGKKINIIILLYLVHLNLLAQGNSTKIPDRTITISGIKTEFLFPHENISGSILVLPGWNFSRTDICENSEFCNLALKKGYVLIMPDMQKSVYASQLYPETRNDWRSFPTLTWVIDSLISYCQKELKLLLPGQNNFLFGISTGGRGVAMISIYSENIFIAGAALSGDYNQLADTSDNLMRGYYGEFFKFPERWKGKDNPLMNANKLKIPLFLAHGKSDNIVPFNQTLNFYDTINKLNPGIGHKIVLKDNAGHNYKFWGSEYNEVFDFFQEHEEK